MKTVRLTMAQALVRFLENQYMEVDGAQHRFVRGMFIIPGHGNVVGLGQALSQEAKHLEIYQGKNEQGMAQAAVAFAKQMKRKQICVATSSVGPGAANMVTACGENDTRVIEPAQLRTDGTQHSNGVRLHSIKFL